MLDVRLTSHSAPDVGDVRSNVLAILEMAAAAQLVDLLEQTGTLAHSFE